MTRGQFDPTLIRRHLVALDEALRNLQRHQGRPLSDLVDNRDEAWIVERGLQLCAQNALDIASHLVASAGRDAGDYAATIDGLAAMGVLPAPFAARFRGVAGFRNLVVHGYLTLDLARVHALLNDRLGDFSEFSRLVEAFIAAP